MGKWLAALGVVILVVLLLLWRQLDSSSATAAPKPDAPAKRPEVAAVAGTPAAIPQPAAKPAEAAPVAAVAKPDDGKWDPQSDEFFHKHDEIVIPQLMRQAVKCWESLPAAKRGEFHRNQNLVATFKQRIRNGVVTIYDVKVERSNIGDTALEACFIQQIRSTTWSNPKLPDWDQDDTIKLGPRTLKKYTRENIEYVGEEMPRQ